MYRWKFSQGFVVLLARDVLHVGNIPILCLLCFLYVERVCCRCHIVMGFQVMFMLSGVVLVT